MSDRPKPATSKPPKSAYSKGSSSKAASQTSSKQNLEPPPFHTHADPSSPAPSFQGRLSNSARCAISDVTASLGGTVLESLIDRDIFIVPHTIIDSEEDDPNGIHRSMAHMVSIYDEATRPKWVRSWDKEEDLPDLGPDNRYRKELYGDARLRNSQFHLEDDAAAAIISRLPSVVECSDLARTRSDLALIRGANEMEWRQAWDQILVKTAHTRESRAKNSINILCERGLNFPYNPYDRGLRDRTLAFFGQRLDAIFLLYRSAQNSDAMNGSDARMDQMVTAAEHISFHYKRVTTLMGRPDADATFDYIIRQRCSAEALTGICDSMLAVPCKDAGFEIHEALFLSLCAASPKADLQKVFDDSVAMMEDFHLVISPTPDNSTPRPTETRDTVHANTQEKGKRPTSSSDIQWPMTDIATDLMRRCKTFLNPFVTDCSTDDGLPRPSFQPKPTPAKTRAKSHIANAVKFREMLATFKKTNKIFLDDDLLLLLLLIEFKKADDDTIHKATNQARTYAAAALKFLERLGVTNQPTYVLVTNGNRGALYMAMYSELGEKKSATRLSKQTSKRKTLIMEWNVRTYDIASIGDAYELSVFMQSLTEQSKRLQERLKILLPEFIARVKEQPNVLKWSMCSWVPKDERAKHRKELVVEIEERQKAHQSFSEKQPAS